MRTLLAILLMLYAQTVTPQQELTEWWQPWVLGAPCTTKIDIAEGTCQLEVKQKPIWK